jgi:hypothetical protein
MINIAVIVADILKTQSPGSALVNFENRQGTEGKLESQDTLGYSACVVFGLNKMLTGIDEAMKGNKDYYDMFGNTDLEAVAEFSRIEKVAATGYANALYDLRDALQHNKVRCHVDADGSTRTLKVETVDAATFVSHVMLIYGIRL